MSESKQADVKPAVIDWTQPVETYAGAPCIPTERDPCGEYLVHVGFFGSGNRAWVDGYGRLPGQPFLGPILRNVSSPPSTTPAPAEAREWTDPANPLPGVELLNDEDDYCGNAYCGATVRIDGEIAGYWSGTGTLLEKTASGRLPRRVINPNHKLADLSAFVAKWRVERKPADPAPKDWSKGVTPKEREVTFLNTRGAQPSRNLPWVSYKGQIVGVIEPDGALRIDNFRRPKMYYGVGPNTCPIPEAAWANIDAWIDGLEAAPADKPVLVVGQWYERKVNPADHWMFMVDGAGLLWRREHGAGLSVAHQPPVDRRVNLKDGVERGEYVLFPAPAPAPEGERVPYTAETWTQADLRDVALRVRPRPTDPWQFITDVDPTVTIWAGDDGWDLTDCGYPLAIQLVDGSIVGPEKPAGWVKPCTQPQQQGKGEARHAR